MSGGPYLLDTHVVIWSVDNPSRLSREASAAILNGEITLSVASFWEVVIKARKNTLALPDPVVWWNRVVASLVAPVLPIRPAHIEAVAALANHHADPFDRILIAQSIAEGFTLITKDASVRLYGLKTLW